jgi:hypothetical protein
MKVAIILTLLISRSLAFIASPTFRKDRYILYSKPDEVKGDKTKKSDESPGDGLDLDLNEMFDM